jgi:hypothetical protein
MKKLILLFIVALAALPAAGQKGNWYLGGVASFSSTTNKSPSIPGAGTISSTTTGWALGPEIGTYLQDNVQLGLYLGLGGSSQSYEGGGTSADVSKTSEFSPTVYTRKFFNISDNLSAFYGFYLTYFSGSTTNYPVGGGTPNEDKYSGFGLRLGVGIAYALSPRFTAVGQYGLIGYQNVSYTNNGQDDGSQSTFDFGVNTIGYGSSAQTGGVFNVGIYYTIKAN